MSKINYDIDALEYIGKLSEGGLRDAITLMDKCLAYSTELTLRNVINSLGIIDYEFMFTLTEHIIKNNTKKAIECIEDLYSMGKDIKIFLKQYIQFLLDVEKLYIGCDWQFVSIPKLDEYVAKIKIFENYSCRDILSTMININAEIKYSNSPKYDIEVGLFELSEVYNDRTE